MDTILSSPLNVSFEFRIEDFRTSREWKTEQRSVGERDQDLHFHFSASVSANGCREDCGGWISSSATVSTLQAKYEPQDCELSWITSVIDIEGNRRFPRSFEQDEDPKRKFCDLTKYIPRSFILDRADEFLIGDVLTLHCDVFLKWHQFDEECERSKTDAGNSGSGSGSGLDFQYLHDDAGELVHKPVDPDKKMSILFEVFFQWSGNSLNSHQVYYESLESVEGRNPRIWSFETHDNCFDIDLEKGLGGQLLEASPVVRQMVSAPMKEQKERRVKFEKFDTVTFLIALYFVSKRKIPNFGFDKLLQVYEFAHMYEMEDLRQKCAEDMMNSLEGGKDFVELKRIADFYSDKYFLKLLNS